MRSHWFRPHGTVALHKGRVVHTMHRILLTTFWTERLPIQKATISINARQEGMKGVRLFPVSSCIIGGWSRLYIEVFIISPSFDELEASKQSENITSGHTQQQFS